MNDYLTCLKSSLDGQTIDNEIVNIFYNAVSTPTLENNYLYTDRNRELIHQASSMEIDANLYDFEISDFIGMSFNHLREITSSLTTHQNRCVVQQIDVVFRHYG